MRSTLMQENDLLGFMYACPFGLIELDESGRIGMINPNAMNHLMPLAGGRSVENFFDVMDRVAPELRNFADSFSEKDGTICDSHRIFVDFPRKNRKGHPQVLACTLIKLTSGQIIGTLSDVTTQVVQEQRLRQADVWFSALMDEVNDHALLTVDADGTVLSVNQSFSRQTGYEPADVIGRSAATLLSEGNGERQAWIAFEEQLSLASRNGWHLFEGWEKRANGEQYWCQCLVVARAETDEDKFSMVLRDVPHSGETTNDLIELLTLDYLTGATNRMQFYKVLRRERLSYINHGKPLSLIILDLDNFKALNDTHGHPAGDVVLKQVAEACNAAAPKDATFARLGGEEFALLVPQCDLGRAVHVADGLRTTIAKLSIPIPDGQLSVTASLGCAELEETQGSTDDLIELADQRLYEAKNAGRNRVDPARA